MHAAAWHRRTPESKFTKFGEEMSIGQTLTMQIVVAIRQEVSEMSAIENLCSPKKWAKIHQHRFETCYPITPPSCQISPRSLQFLHPSIFWLTRRTSGPKVTGLGSGVHQLPAKFCPVPTTPLQDICCQTSPTLLRDPQKHTVNDMPPHYMPRQQINGKTYNNAVD